MAKQNGLFLLLSIYTALLAAASCGTEYRIGFVVAAFADSTTATTQTTVNPKLATCDAGSDDGPHCDDHDGPAVTDGGDAGTAAAMGARRARGGRRPDGAGRKRRTDNTSRDATATTTTTSEDDDSRAVCPTDEHCQQTSRTPKFRNGDIIELYNTESRDIQIVFPSIVKARDPSDPTGGYRVTKTTDGTEVKNLPEKFLHMYVPYSEGDEALCNIGEFRANRPIIVRCTVRGYEAAAKRGAMVLQGNYSVQVHATKANEEYTTNLPVWKLQRRYLATAKAAA